MKSPYESGVLVLCSRRWSLMLRPFSLWMGFEPLSEASLRALSPQVCFLVVLAEADSLWLSLALSSVLACPMLWLHVRLHDTCSRSKVVLDALPWILPDGVRASVRGFSSHPAAAGAFFPGGPRCGCVSSRVIGSLHCSSLTVGTLTRPPALPFLLSAGCLLCLELSPSG